MAVPTRNGVHKGKAFQGRGFPIVKMGEVYSSDVVASMPRDLLALSDNELKRLELEKCDLLFCRTSLVAEGVGRCAIVGHLSERTTFASNLIRVRLDAKRARPRYWFYFFRAPVGRHLVGSIARGTTVTTITGPDLANLRVRVPTVSEQDAVASILGALDDKIDLNRRMSNTLEQIARALFKHLFVEYLRAERGELVSLRDFATLTKGRSYRSQDLAPSDRALVTLKSFNRGGGYREDGLKSYTGTFKLEQVVRPGEIIVACTDVTQAAEVIGRPAIVGRTSQFNALVASLDTAILRPHISGPSRAFLYYLTRSDQFTAYAVAHTTGTTVLHLKPDVLLDFKLGRVPNDLMSAFDAVAEPTIERHLLAAQENETLADLRDTLLPKLISGDLNVSDAERLVSEVA